MDRLITLIPHSRIERKLLFFEVPVVLGAEFIQVCYTARVVTKNQKQKNEQQ